jgi:hypothetical protein
MQSLCRGIETAFDVYKEQASDYQMARWREEFQWYFVKWAFIKIKYLESESDFEAARACFKNLRKIGALDCPPNKWACEVRDNIFKFIKE